ncbi:DUF7507 domain-containing protein [Paenibacillus glycanilyticus]|uniref:DUF7507 domain-containing protein n=1 Tax=Paenibacillus glycanilyticus TaxID=126569 RepID=UPI001910848A|nr:DUF11 domain-containing protein [Paenibacillus glycanilyticus]
MPFILRFSGNDSGAITFTGNTLGLSRSSTEGVPGTRDYIGDFITVNTALQFGSYPPGSTSDFNLDSSMAMLRLPEDSTVLYAELVWAGTYRVSGGTNNYLPFIDKSVSITTPQGTTLSVAPDPATAQVSYRNATYNYFRSANVTSIVQAGGAGPYIVGGVVGNIDFGNSTANSCGWTLCVVYEDTNMPFRNLSLNVGIVEIAAGSDPSVTTVLTGFATPVSGPVSGRMALCAQDGDANKVGDQVLFGPNETSLTILSGPNNFPNNFFASQINDDSGQLDTSGTFGDRNQINGEPGTQIVGGRQSWDITNVDISETLTNNQTTAAFQLRTSNDGYSVIAAGIYIDINSPRITVQKSVNAETAELGQTLTYTVIVSNSGTAAADAVFLLDSLPNDTSFVPGSVTVDGAQTEGNPLTGISLGILEPGGTITVTFQAVVESYPEDGLIRNQALVEFQYESIIGGPILAGDIPSNEVITTIIPPDYELALVKSVDREIALPGETVQYTITVTNLSNAPLTNVRVTDPTLSLDQTIPILPAGESRSFPVAFVVPPGTRGNTGIVNIASAVSDQTGPVLGSATVLIPALPGLAVDKTANRSTAAPGDTIIYSIKVTNTGNIPLTNVQVSDPLLGLVETTGILEPGQSITIQRSYVVPLNAANGSIIANAVTVVSVETPPVTDQEETTVVPPPVDLTKSASPDEVTVGEQITYSVTIVNRGQTPLVDLRLSDILQEPLEFVPGSVRVNGQRRPGVQPDQIALGTLPPGAEIEVTFRAVANQVSADEKVMNQAVATFRVEVEGPTFQVPSNPVEIEVKEEEE